jgi:acyltransferase-like protein
MSRTSIALGNLRAVVILIVLAFHSSLAYLASLPAIPYRFDSPPYLWQAIPIIDRERWFCLDLFCAWQDVSLMSMMFFLSGLFVPSSLARKGSWKFLSDRFVRIGAPFVVVVLLLMPLAYYPAYRVPASDPSVAAYWQSWLALPFWPCGPQWFLWQLLVLNVLAAAMHRFAPGWSDRLGRLAEAGRDQPVRLFTILSCASAVAYIPLALVFLPWEWTHATLFSFQLSRPLHYLVYFFAGFAIGVRPLDRGLLARDGPLARRWLLWLFASLIGFGLWAAPTSITLDNANAPPPLQLAAGFGYVLACASGCFALLAICLRFACQWSRTLDSLSANAYGIYLLHYVFVVWLQFALMEVALFAVAKFAIVFAVTLALSWPLSATAGGVSFGVKVAGARR